MKKVFLLLSISCLLAACLPDVDVDTKKEFYPEEEFDPAEEDVTVNLKLSVDGQVYTEDVDFEFEIIEGNGGYMVSVSGDEDKDAKVTINGSKVTVNLLSSMAFIIITDQKQQSTHIEINSSAESLAPHSYGVSMDVGRTYTLKNITFGAGGYTLRKIKGTSAEATMIENDCIKITGLKPGNSYYKIIDKRGTTAPLNISVDRSYDLINNNIEITAISDQTVFVILKWGEGDWMLVEEPSSAILKIFLMKKADIDKKYDVLQIDTSRDVKGTVMIRLKDKAGNYAWITVKVQ